MFAGTMLMLGLLCSSSTLAPNVFPINQRNIMIPLHLDPSRRADMKELILYSSSDQGQTWQQVAVATPDKDSFIFYAPTDGLYWFSVCVVDQRGNREPPDVSRVPPMQKILVDTLKPVLRIVSAQRQGDEAVVTWEIQEEHPDLATLKLEYHPMDAPATQWYTAMVTPTLTGQTRFHLSSAAGASVRMYVQDVAQNATVTNAEVPPGPMTAQNMATTFAAGGPPSTTAGAFPPGPSALPPPPGAAPAPEGPPPPQPVQQVRASEPSMYQQATTTDAGPANHWLVSSDTPPGASTSGGCSGTRPPGTSTPAQIINTTQVSLDYEVTKVGPSGIGKVELWMTQDDGRSWRKFAEDPHLKPPMVVELPGEGVYGLALVVQSRAGLGKRPPMAGDAPEMRIEVDTTPPIARLALPEQDPHRRDALVISWSVTDRNLDPTPIGLFWAKEAGGPWEPIGTELANTGRYTWQLPPSLPYKVHLRLTARDTAGNTSEVVTPEPVLVDLNEPEGRILGVAAVPRHP